MKWALFRLIWLAVFVAAVFRPADAGAAEARKAPWRMEFWRDSDGTLSGGDNAVTLVRPMENTALTGDVLEGAPGGEDDEPIITYVNMGSRSIRVVPRDEFNRFAGSTAMLDRGIDSADTRWRRQARLTGVNMRMLNGPEGTLHFDGVSSSTEKGGRTFAGVVVPLNPRWELAVINKLASFELKETGRKAGVDALTLRVGANPSVSFRPWFELTPYVGLHDRGGGGVGMAGGVSKIWSSGMSLEGEAYAWQPWDEGYETARNDGLSHGVRVRGTLPVNRRLAFTGEADYEWLRLGSKAPGGSENAGRRGSWQIRAEYKILKRDGCYMGYGFREQNLWNEQLVPVELGLFADVYQQRYIRPRGFTALNPTEKSLRERVGVFYYQAVTPKIGFSAEAFVGQDPSRGIDAGELYGFAARLNLVFSPRLRVWCDWGYDSSNSSLSGGGGPNRNLSLGLNYNF